MVRKIVISILAGLILSGCKTNDRQEAEPMRINRNEYYNVRITGADLSALSEEETEILDRQAAYCQAMTEADTDAMREMVSEDMQYVHMSGRKQTREEYFADIESGALTYYTIGIDHPVIEVSGDTAEITYTSVLNANAYGARGTFRMKGTHHYRKLNGEWILVNG